MPTAFTSAEASTQARRWAGTQADRRLSEIPVAHLADGVAAAQRQVAVGARAPRKHSARAGQPRTGGRAQTPRAGGHLADGVAAEQLVDAAARRTRLGREMRGDRVTGSGATRSNRWP